MWVVVVVVEGAVEAALAARTGREELEAGRLSSKEVHVGGGRGGGEGNASRRRW